MGVRVSCNYFYNLLSPLPGRLPADLENSVCFLGLVEPEFSDKNEVCPLSNPPFHGRITENQNIVFSLYYSHFLVLCINWYF